MKTKQQAKEELLRLVSAAAEPQAIHQTGSVWEIWEDGELTLTKSGELYGQRGLHQMSPPVIGLDIGPQLADLGGVVVGDHVKLALGNGAREVENELIKYFDGTYRDLV